MYILDCCCLVAKSCLTLLDPMNYSPLGSSVHGISQARILEWVSISFFRNQTWVSCIVRRPLSHQTPTPTSSTLPEPGTERHGVSLSTPVSCGLAAWTELWAADSNSSRSDTACRDGTCVPQQKRALVTPSAACWALLHTRP